MGGSLVEMLARHAGPQSASVHAVMTDGLCKPLIEPPLIAPESHLAKNRLMLSNLASRRVCDSRKPLGLRGRRYSRGLCFFLSSFSNHSLLRLGSQEVGWAISVVSQDRRVATPGLGREYRETRILVCGSLATIFSVGLFGMIQHSLYHFIRSSISKEGAHLAWQTGLGRLGLRMTIVEYNEQTVKLGE